MPALNLIDPALNRLLDHFLDEDLGRGDLTAVAVGEHYGGAYWIAKQPGVFCGGPFIKLLFKRLDDEVQIRQLVADGESFISGQRLLEIEGPARILVAGERTALNISMRLSGVSTATARLVRELVGTNIQLVDTRKTTPGIRLLEKYAVRCGGGINHRFGLDDAAMLKENHIAWSGGITKAVKAVRAAAPWTSRVIVEAESLDQAEEAVRVGADAVLLDEFSPDHLEIVVPKLRELALVSIEAGGSGKIILEASGVDPMAIKKYASTGVDLISTSSPITRSPWLDFSMRFEKNH